MIDTRKNTTRQVKLSLIDDVHHDVIAAAGLIEAIHAQYAYEGVLSLGALLYTAQLVERIAVKVQDMETGLEEE